MKKQNYLLWVSKLLYLLAILWFSITCSISYAWWFQNAGGPWWGTTLPSNWQMSTPEAGNTYEWDDSSGNPCDPEKDIMLNMDIPFIGRCIKKDPKANAAADSQGNSTIGNVFPKLMGWLIRIVMTMIYVIGFLGILAGGFMIAGNGALGTKETGWKLITSIIAGLILLWASGIILNLINPDFFGTISWW